MGLIPLYRMWKPAVRDHFYTVEANEYDRAARDFGYTKEGIAGYVFSSPQAGAAPLFRLWNTHIADHFYTLSAEERDSAVRGGYTFEGLAGYIYPYGSNLACGGWQPLYRVYSGAAKDHFYTASDQERKASIVKYGYTDEGVTGWIVGQ